MLIDRINEKFVYSAGDGTLRFRGCNKIAGSERTGHSGITYIKVKIDGGTYYAHRIIMIMNGYKISTDDQVDHIDGNGLNNKLENLRVVNNSENHKNQKLSKNNKIGIPGVYFRKSRSGWHVEIYGDGNRHFLGLFKSLFDACCARKGAELKFGFHANHGRR